MELARDDEEASPARQRAVVVPRVEGVANRVERRRLYEDVRRVVPSLMITAADAVASKTTEPRASRAAAGTWAVPADSVRIFGFLAAAFHSAAAALHRAATKGSWASGAGGAPPPSTRMASTRRSLASSKLDRIVALVVCSNTSNHCARAVRPSSDDGVPSWTVCAAVPACYGKAQRQPSRWMATLHNRWRALGRGAAATQNARRGAET